MAKLSIVDTHSYHDNMRTEEIMGILLGAIPKWMHGHPMSFYEQHLIRHMIQSIRGWQPPSDQETESIVASVHGMNAQVRRQGPAFNWNWVAYAAGAIAIASLVLPKLMS